MFLNHIVLRLFVALGIGMLIAIVCAAVFYLQLNPGPPRQQFFFNGKILTMNPHNDIAEAVVIEGERIAAVGSYEDLRPKIDDTTEVHDLKGRTMMPGFIDAHGHFPGSALSLIYVDLNSPPIGTVDNIDVALDLLKKKAKATSKGEWIFGFGYDDTSLEDGRHFRLQELDQVSSDHPIYVVHISGHLGVGNSRALYEMGISNNSPNPVGGEIGRDPATGELNGLLFETAHDPVADKAFDVGLFDRFRILRAASKEYLSKGVTTAQNGLANEEIASALSMLSWLGVIPLRLVVWPEVKSGGRFLDREIAARHQSGKFSVGAVKFVTDGSIQAYTGYLRQPYWKQAPANSADYRGYPVIPQDELDQLVIDAHRKGHQLALHANGDAAIDATIASFRKAQDLHYREDARPIIVHAQMLRKDQMAEVKRLGITLSFFLAHTYYWGDRHREIFLGPDRAVEISPAKTALDKGIPFTLHLDTPVVPMDPMLMVWAAVNRLSASGHDMGAAERISVIEALRAVTTNAAWQVFEEKTRGSIEAGKFADLIILSDDPLGKSKDLRDLRVLETIVGGVSRWQTRN